MTIDTEPINIKDLFLTTPERGEFDIRKEMSSEVWQKVLGELHKLVYDSHVAAPNPDEKEEAVKRAANLATNMMLILPNRRDELKIDYLRDDLVMNLLAALPRQNHRELGALVASALRLKTLFPDAFAQTSIYQDNQLELFQELVADSTKAVSRRGGYGLAVMEADHVTSAKMVLPDEFKNGISEWEWYYDLIKVSLWSMLKDDHSWDKAINTMANMRIIWPDRFDQFGLTPEVEERFQQEFEKQKQEALLGKSGWNNFTYIARSMAVLSAENIVVNRNEVRIILPSSLQLMTQNESLPETRRF